MPLPRRRAAEVPYIPVFHRPEQSVLDNDSFSPSAGKPERFVARIRSDPRVRIIDDWQPLRRGDLYLAHDRRYVDGVLDGVLENGFGNTLMSVADSLPFTSGSLYHAAVRALDHGIALSPTSGFHHATHAGGGGFCTFNGLVVTALLTRRRHRVRKVGIVDLDMHYGNGTVHILETLRLRGIEHLSYGALSNRSPGPRDWLDRLDGELQRFRGCDLLLFQAGVDPHVDDPLGGDLTTDELRERDRIVFAFAKARGIPLAWNLAGGYQPDFSRVLDLHENTLRECIGVYCGGA